MDIIVGLKNRNKELKGRMDERERMWEGEG
jgi:hypothetical protein